MKILNMSKTSLFRSVYFAMMYKPMIYKSFPKRHFGDQTKTQPLKLMHFPQTIWPSLFKTIKNYFFAFLIRTHYDPAFSLQTFLEGSEQAIAKVSTLISKGDFGSLDDLVTTDAIKEIETNYHKLSEAQRKGIEINSDDIFLRSVYEIGVMMENNSDKKFVEITTVLQGFHGLEKVREGSINEISTSMMMRPKDIYVCNYRFFKELTKKEDDEGWIINRLNHFNPKD